jgi:hypothetical protein
LYWIDGGVLIAHNLEDISDQIRLNHDMSCMGVSKLWSSRGLSLDQLTTSYPLFCQWPLKLVPESLDPRRRLRHRALHPLQGSLPNAAMPWIEKVDSTAFRPAHA